MKLNQTPSLTVAKNIPDGGIFLEVGTWEGDFSYALLKNTNCKKLYCVDPYKKFTDNSYPDGMNSLSQEEFDLKYSNVKNKFLQFEDRVEFVRTESVKASILFEDNSLDFVYIDGNHNYPNVLQDILVWYPKVKSGGYLTGDDIYSTNLNEHDDDGNVTRIWYRDSNGNPSCWGKYGTYKALVDAQKILRFNFQIIENQFIIRKD